MSSLAFLRDDFLDLETGESGYDVRRPSTETLAAFALEEALSVAERRRIARDTYFALVIQVPSEAWVEPVCDACRRLTEWSHVVARAGSPRGGLRPDLGNETVAERLSQGGRVLGVSQAPDRYLPSALVGAADLRVRLVGATDTVVARAVRAATGRCPRIVPPGAARGLDYFEVAAALRGRTARECLGRLAAAVRAKATVDPSVAEAPAFATLTGFGEAHAWGSRFLRELETWRETGAPAFQRIERHLALGSAPGLGKSTFVRALAKAADLRLVQTSVGSWFSASDGYLGGVLRAWETTYASACAAAPSILFLDEADALPSRESLTDRGRDFWTPVCTSVLLGIDGLNAPGSPEVCVIAATNFSERLDPALVRPGRLGRVIRIHPPSAPELAAIMRQHLDDGELPGQDLTPVGELALGGTGAQVVGWISQARAAARAAGRPMQVADLAYRIAPPDRSTTAERRLRAVHEAGHAIGFELRGAAYVKQVDLVPRPDSSGATSINNRLGTSPTRTEIENLVVALLCGRAAETVLIGEPSAGAGGDAQSDLARATALVAGCHGTYGLGEAVAYRGPIHEVTSRLALDPVLLAAVEVDLARLNGEALRLIEAHRTLVETVAERLLAERVLSGDALRAIMNAVPPSVAARSGGAA
ncbi:AAA family ATPase [Methylobacterium sp. J-070]|uniref:AAA family ATPase n=1 Tax=Methylobacterium sp. J-070 TaxID=2836650 RepID=UPI001FBBA874|nr:AAA family ATPase [Methylobacterium sp. J-070]MCJ2054099.1 AAA family ATPase [Methylobacterium sp. J-070]